MKSHCIKRLEKGKKCEGSVGFLNIYLCPSVFKTTSSSMGRGAGCAVHKANVSCVPVTSSARQPPVMGFGVWGCFFGVHLLSGERCACCGFPVTISYKYLKNLVCNQFSFCSRSSFFGRDKNPLICFGFVLLFVPLSSESS